MKIAVIGAGAMGSIFGGKLAQAGEDVTMLDVWQEGVDTLNANGLRVEDKSGTAETIQVKATTDPSTVGKVDLALVFVKCYHTEEAVRNAAPIIGDQTIVMTLQNGWGNAPRIASIVGEERMLVGLTYHSATVLGAANIQHAGKGMTFMGELDGSISDRLKRIADAFQRAGFDVTMTPDILKEIWSKLALNVCTLPTSSLLRFFAGQLIEHEGTMDLMRGLLREVVNVANAQNISLSYDERWEAITSLLQRAKGAKASMLQDVEKGRRTEIDVINGAIVEAGRKLNIPTPYNDTMVWLVKALEETF
jgi:2-dehydropantoate 2-reductase